MLRSREAKLRALRLRGRLPCVRIGLGILEPMTRSRSRLACAALLMSGLAPFLAGCDEPHQAVASAPAQTSEPEVSVVTVAPRARAVVRELPGRIAPTRVADVRPRVSGIVVERSFSQGSEVRAGDTLYRIDPRPFEVDLQSSEAALA